MTKKSHILVVDDDPRICRTLRQYLKREGYLVSIAANGEEMWLQFDKDKPDLVILDLILPGVDGITLALELRKISDVGIIMLTGKDDPVDTIIGLEIGADDYVTKPFDERQLLARIRSLLRRSTVSVTKANVDTDMNSQKIQFEGWQMDLSVYELISPSGEKIDLTTYEFKLLEIFVQNTGNVLSRNQIMQHLYQRGWSLNDRSVDVLIGKLRKRIEQYPQSPVLIKTIRGSGYMFTARVHFE